MKNCESGKDHMVFPDVDLGDDSSVAPENLMVFAELIGPGHDKNNKRQSMDFKRDISTM